jgi:hypothetical protein
VCITAGQASRWGETEAENGGRRQSGDCGTARGKRSAGRSRGPTAWVRRLRCAALRTGCLARYRVCADAGWGEMIIVLGRGEEGRGAGAYARTGCQARYRVSEQVSMRSRVGSTTQARNETRIWLFAATERRARRRATPTLLGSVVLVPGLW